MMGKVGVENGPEQGGQSLDALAVAALTEKAKMLASEAEADALGSRNEDRPPWVGSKVIAEPASAESVWAALTMDEPGIVKLWARSASNKKVPPNTLLAVLKDGRVLHSDDGFKYELKGSMQKLTGFLVKSGQAPELKSLSEMMTTTGATSLAKHDIADAKHVKCASSKKLSFCPSDDILGKFLLLAEKLSQLKLVWMFKVGDKTLNPYGVAVCTAKQVVIPGAESLQLS